MQNEVLKTEDKSINWHTAVFMALFHIGAVAALFMFSWQAMVAAIVLWWISASLGVGMGFHRLLTHRGYKTPKVVEYILWLWRAARSTGWLPIAFIMRIQMGPATRTRRAMAAGGRISGGC